MSGHIIFNANIGNKKPESIINREAVCPFCDTARLEGILETRNNMIWLRNKFPVLENSFQTIIIETDICDLELSTYSKSHLYNVLQFAVEKWREMQQSGEFASVILFKNHGAYSGGTIRHPHMQIVGFKDYDYLKDVKQDHFDGIMIAEADGVECNVSTKPRIGFYEFNVILSKLSSIHIMADYIQILAHYMLQSLNTTCQSYNVFFYQFSGKIIAKVVPRFVASPLFVGYSIPQVMNANKLLDVVKEIQASYL